MTPPALPSAAPPPSTHLVVCTPCYGGVVGQGYMLSVASLLLLGVQQGFTVSVELLGYESLVTRGRNTLVARFLDRAEATHLLFVDADISFDAAQVLRMLALDQPVVAGMYPLKTLDWSEAAIGRLRGGEPLATAPLRYVGLPCEGAARQERDGFVTGEYAGTGFMLLRRDALTALTAAHPELRYTTAHTAARPDPSPHQYALFDCMIDPETGHYLSEDYTFCRRWRALGGLIWLDTQGALVHTGPSDFIGRPALRHPLPAAREAA